MFQKAQDVSEHLQPVLRGKRHEPPVGRRVHSAHAVPLGPAEYQREPASDFFRLHQLDQAPMPQIPVDRPGFPQPLHCLPGRARAPFCGSSRELHEIAFSVSLDPEADIAGVLVIVYLKHPAVFTEEGKVEGAF